MGILFLIYLRHKHNTGMLRDNVCICLEVVTRRINICVIEAARDGLCSAHYTCVFNKHAARTFATRDSRASMAARNTFICSLQISRRRGRISLSSLPSLCITVEQVVAPPGHNRRDGAGESSLSALTKCEGGELFLFKLVCREFFHTLTRSRNQITRKVTAI